MNPEEHDTLPGSFLNCTITGKQSMKIDFEVVKRYLEGKGSKGDRDQLIDWFSDIRYEKDIHEKFRSFWDSMEKGKLEDCDRAALLGEVYRRIKKDDFRQQRKKKGKVQFLNILQKIAAVLFIPLVITFWLTRVGNFTTGSGTAYSELYSPPGTRTRFHLTDGSTGWLNGGSYLEFPTEFRGKSRGVRLRGEAYFDVVPDAKKPFIVQGEHASVVVRGTSFNVQAFPDDPEIWITLASGRIDVFGNIDGKSVRLTELHPDQMCIYRPDKKSHRVEAVDADKITAWTEGKLVFRQEPMTDVARRIERWFNVRVVLADEELENYSFRATFQDDSLEEVMRLLAMTSPISYMIAPRKLNADGTYEKEVVTIYKTK